MSHTPPSIYAFSENADLDYEIRCALGNSVVGAGEPGEILAAIAGVKKNDHHGWLTAWTSLGHRTMDAAEASASAGSHRSAADAYLRASAYLGIAVNAASALADGDAMDTAFAAQRAAWEGFLAHTAHRVDTVAIPYEDSALTGWFFRPSTETAPMLVIVNGSDGSWATLWSIAAPALARGYNVLLFDGPGQQSELFDKSTSFRPDWEAVLTPVFDFVQGLDGVDATRIALYGISQGGYWVTRALAFEHHFIAAVTDPGVVDVSTSWTTHVPHSLLKKLDAGDIAGFDKDMALGMTFSPDTARTWTFRARPYGTTGYGETIQRVREYNASTVAHQITTPLLILSPESEQFWPGQAAQLAALTSGISTLVPFTAAEGADGHCQPLARTLTAQRLFDWLDQRVSVV